MESLADVAQILAAALQLGFKSDAESQARLSPPLRRLHRTVLRAFLEGGGPPSASWLAEQAAGLSLEPDQAIAGLAEADLVHVGGESVAVAYPFSGQPTAHRVQLDGAQPVWAMCALDALGVLLMSGSEGTVLSCDPDTEAPIRVERHDGHWQWEPPGAVLLLAFTGTCQPSAEGLCPQIDFHTDARCAEAHLGANEKLIGQAVDQATALELADRVFGGLLDE